MSFETVKKFEDAIADFTRAIKIDPNYVRAHKNLGLQK